MAIRIDATEPRILDSGLTAKQSLEAFVTVQTAGARELAKRLEEMAIKALKDPQRYLEKAAMDASEPLKEAYKNAVGDVTGNLKKSIAVRRGKKRYPGVGIAVTGPLMTGRGGATEKDGSGNAAWLVEFGSGPRRPATQNRITYLNVHQAINGRFRRLGNSGRPFNNKQFERMGRGYYFLMGSKNEPTRQARRGSGYPHDFLPDENGGTHPYFLEPGETYKAMPAKHALENSIKQTSPAVLSTLLSAMSKYIEEL